MNYWLLKTEPDSFSIEDLQRAPRQTTCWDGVRNYQARNFMRDEMKSGDLVLVYHSSVQPAGVVGVAEVVREAYPDHTAQDPRSDYYDDKATADNPIWMMVDIRLQQRFESMITLEQLRGEKSLAKMELLRKGSRLSVQRVSSSEYQTVMRLAEQQASPLSSAGKTSTAGKSSTRR